MCDDKQALNHRNYTQRKTTIRPKQERADTRDYLLQAGSGNDPQPSDPTSHHQATNILVFDKHFSPLQEPQDVCVSSCESEPPSAL